MRDFVQIATHYAEQVISGDILACQWVILACERFINDLDRSANNPDFPYVLNPLMRDSEGKEYRPAERACYFIELLPHVKGRWAKQRKTIELEPWQIFILVNIFGWIHRETALRRFKTVHVEVPRKNAKTTIAAGVGLYLTIRDDEEGAEIYSAATTRDQAFISWSIAKQMTDRSPGMQNRFGVRTFAHSIAQEESGSFFQYLSSDTKGLDGLNISGAVIDELHAHKTREVYDVIETATGSREQPVILGITTAGSNRSGICYEQRSYLTKILRGVDQDETFFGIIYTIDDDDDWTDPAIWAKANPNLGVSVFEDDLRRKCAKAVSMPSAQNNFKTKHLNVWVNADTIWMNMQEWDACGDEALDITEFAGEPCHLALDLSSKIDIAAKGQMFKRAIAGEWHYYAFMRYYLPEKTVNRPENDHYQGWVNAGLLTPTPGNVIDYAYIEDDMKADSSQFEVTEVDYDPFQATQLSTRMMDEGFNMVEMRPTVLNFSEPMKELEALVLQRRFHHNGDPILAWMVSNVVCHTDLKDNIYPRKEREENKIDGVIAILMMLGRMITSEAPKKSVYEQRGIISL